MCRNIRTLANFAPPATTDEIQAAALQYVRKVAGTTHPSKANQEAFARAVQEITAVTDRLLAELGHRRPTAGPPDRGGQGQGSLGRAIRYA
jgi:hypothetical protein